MELFNGIQYAFILSWTKLSRAVLPDLGFLLVMERDLGVVDKDRRNQGIGSQTFHAEYTLDENRVKFNCELLAKFTLIPENSLFSGKTHDLR